MNLAGLEYVLSLSNKIMKIENMLLFLMEQLWVDNQGN
jgi:hypothetical protein